MARKNRKVASAGPRAEERGGGPTNLGFRELESHVFEDQRPSTEFRLFAAQQILPQLDFSGYKRDQKAELAIQVVHNLVMAKLAGKVVSDSRNTHQPSVALRVHIWDAVCRAGLAEVCKGSQESGKVSRYRATERLMVFHDTFPNHLLDLRLDRNTANKRPSVYAPVVLQIKDEDGTKTPQPFPYWPHYPGLWSYMQDLEDTIETINRANLKHSWQAFHVDPDTGNEHVYQPNVCLRLIYSGEWGRYGRLHSWSPISGQDLPKEQRKTMLIDGKSVTELDYSGFATRMLYHLRRIDPKGDIYRPEAIMPRSPAWAADQVRAFVKQATNACWNVTSRKTAEGSVWKLVRDDATIRKILYEIERIKPADVVSRIMRVHAPLAERFSKCRPTGFFFTGIGLNLMAIDGWIMMTILTRFADAGKPALGIHDAVVCKRIDAQFARQSMRRVYHSLFQFWPDVKKSF